MANRMSRRRFLQVSGAVTSLGVLAACVAPGGAPEAGGEGGNAPSSDTVNLIWDTFRGPGTGWNEERIDTFKESHPNVSIEFRPLTGSSQQDNYGKMYAMHAAGDLGDIVAFDPSHYHFWRAIEAGIIGPIQDLADADNLDQSQWFEQFMVLQHYQDTLYGLPSWGWAGHDTLVINKKHFDEAGIEAPDPMGHETSMDTYGEWARSFYQENERFGLAFAYGESAVSVLCRIWNTSFIDPEGTKCLILEDENAQAALRWLYDLSVTDGVLPAPGDNLNANAAQLEGKVTMVWGGSLNTRNFQRDITDESIAEAWQGLFPTREDGKFPSQIRGGTWNMNAGTQHPQEVYDFLKHITNLEGCIGFNLVAGQGALVRPDVLQELISQNPIHEWFVPNLENGIPAYAPANSRGREYTDAIGQRIQILLDKNAPIPFEQGLEELHKSVQDVLDMEPA
ncbi:MAG TPA: substrate-binding domain-containing protein [Caldilineaceae bacterium]|nr:substrate-binding domain-containing protein [Caldilineaceae bacterium]